MPNFSGIVYRNIYPGVDAHIFGATGQLQTRWEAKTGADLSQIRFDYNRFDTAHPKGNGAVSVTNDGGLSVSAPWGTLSQSALVPSGNGSSKVNPGSGVAPQGHALSPSAGAAGGTASGVTLVYSTYLGGSSDDFAYGVAVDGNGNAYVTGFTFSTDFPTMNPFQGANASGSDVFVAKLNVSGTALIYSTYLGGNSSSAGIGIAVDVSGSAYVTGNTHASNFPVMNPFQGANAGAYDVFVSKLSASGSALVYSTYLGGGDGDEAEGITVDGSGSAYVTGYTLSANFPVINPLQGANAGSKEAFVSKLSASGLTLIYSTYLGGSSDDESDGIAVDGGGGAYVTGWTYSTDFPLMNPFQGANAGGGAFVSKLNASGTALDYGTYLGGSGEDRGYMIAVDGSGSAYVTGYTVSANFPLMNPVQVANAGSNDVFVTKLSVSGSTLVYCTYLGGSGDDVARGIAVDGNGNAYVTGRTYSTNFPLMNPFLGADAGGADAFVTKLSDQGTPANCAGNSLQFDGSDDEVLIPHSSKLSFGAADPMTVELWFKWNGTGGTFHLLGKRPACADMNYQLGGTASTLSFGSNGTGANIQINFPVGTDQWTHVAGTSDGSDVRIYVNGVFQASAPGSLANTNSSPLKIGGSGSCASFPGEIDEVRIWNVARSATEIADNYLRSVDPNTPGLVGYWTFDEDFNDQRVFDLSPSANDGTLGASASAGGDDPARVASTAPHQGRNGCIQEPVVLVHGWLGDVSTWDRAKMYLKSAGFRHIWVANSIAKCGVPGEENFNRNAQNLATFIKGAATAEGYPLDGPINIVTHSMGGLVARRLLVTPQDFGFTFTAKNLIMLGTPNDGAEWGGTQAAYWFQRINSCSDGPAWFELSPTYMLIFNALYSRRELASQTSYYGVAGWAGCDKLSGKPKYHANCSRFFSARLRTACPHDGIVSVVSALGGPKSLASSIKGWWCHTTTLGNALVYYNDPILFADFITPILVGASPSTLRNTDVTSEGASTPESQVIVDSCDSLPRGGGRSISVKIDGGDATIDLLASDRYLSLVLESPTGKIWDSTAALADPTVDYISDSDGRSFSFTGVEPGTWIVHVDASTIDSLMAFYCITGAVSNTVRLDASIPQEYFWHGETVWVTASVTENDLGLPGAAVTALPVQEGYDTLNQVILVDDGTEHDGLPGDGVYGGSFTPTVDSGGLSIMVSANGVASSGISFHREQTKAIAILPASFLPGDMNGDGTFDVLDVVLLVGYVFRGAPAPVPPQVGDANCDAVANVLDVVRLIEHVFRGGAQPSCP